MDNNIKTLGEELPEEIKRVQEIIAEYKSLPKNAGAIGAALMQKDVDIALKAIMEGDIITMVQIYKELKEWVR